MILSDIFAIQSIKVNLESATKEDAFMELIEAIAAVHPEFNQDEMFTAVNEREHKMATGIGSGAAVPHGYYRGIRDMVGAIGISQTGIDYDAPDHKPVHIVFLLLMSQSAQEDHLRILNRIFRLLTSEAGSLIRAAQNTREVQDILSRFH